MNPSVINGIDKILDLLRKHETFLFFKFDSILLAMISKFYFGYKCHNTKLHSKIKTNLTTIRLRF